ncbi:hypothetical protein NEOLEDRAFT_1143571 [Neolentinus lepideus HHB14362 ss-1]|uniref:Uncharacterized protein n=1 Tax=Neolentinus lepideus HHB14362 ss-1 TaxID=1314782 RepID=A0A165MGG1_9AGAM|nr:hypothetical protein NEOLEDRAFT_1143571 [Neolentinus lepideus HHB14362 ss-1]
MDKGKSMCVHMSSFEGYGCQGLEGKVLMVCDVLMSSRAVSQDSDSNDSGSASRRASDSKRRSCSGSRLIAASSSGSLRASSAMTPASGVRLLHPNLHNRASSVGMGDAVTRRVAAEGSVIISGCRQGEDAMAYPTTESRKRTGEGERGSSLIGNASQE